MPGPVGAALDHFHNAPVVGIGVVSAEPKQDHPALRRQTPAKSQLAEIFVLCHDARQACTSAAVRWSYSLRICAVVQPRPKRSTTNSTEMRVPLMIGFPTRTFGSTVIRSCQFMIHPQVRQESIDCVIQMITEFRRRRNMRWPPIDRVAWILIHAPQFVWTKAGHTVPPPPSRIEPTSTSRSSILNFSFPFSSLLSTYSSLAQRPLSRSAASGALIFTPRRSAITNGIEQQPTEGTEEIPVPSTDCTDFRRFFHRKYS